jgi:hypothetical protein
MNGDGKADLCGRSASGFSCVPSTGTGFGSAIDLGEMTDTGGWGNSIYYSTILMGGPSCVPSAEVCNGKDDDCDGQIDEGACEPDGGTVSDSGPLADSGYHDSSVDTGSVGQADSSGGGYDGGGGNGAGIVDTTASSDSSGCSVSEAHAANRFSNYLLAAIGFSLTALRRRRRQ